VSSERWRRVEKKILAEYSEFLPMTLLGKDNTFNFGCCEE
jgi:hypothetical protein